MRHSYFGSKLSRTKNERRRLFMIQVRSLIVHGAITTTIAKARAVAPIMEKLITLAKKGRDVDAKNANKVIADRVLVKKLFEEAKTRFATRTGGYTRIVKLGGRPGDATEEARLSFVDVAIDVIPPKSKIKDVKESPPVVKSKKNAAKPVKKSK